jgi:light-regulated signal transduction histidine kinase (bacteriophytochrome)
MEMRVIELTKLIEEARAESVRDVGAREIDWQIKWLPAVLGDARLLRQAFVNVLANAIRLAGCAPQVEPQVCARQTPASVRYAANRCATGNRQETEPQIKTGVFKHFCLKTPVEYGV